MSSLTLLFSLTSSKIQQRGHRVCIGCGNTYNRLGLEPKLAARVTLVFEAKLKPFLMTLMTDRSIARAGPGQGQGPPKGRDRGALDPAPVFDPWVAEVLTLGFSCGSTTAPEA